MSGHRPRRNALAMYEQHAGPNMTPMVDVVMVILIFFMTSAAILGPEWFLKTNLPKPAGTASPEVARSITVRIELIMQDEVAMVLIDGAAATNIDSVALALALAIKQATEQSTSSDPSTPSPAPGGPSNVIVLVKASDNVPYANVVQVHETARSLGIDKIGIVGDTAK